MFVCESKKDCISGDGSCNWFTTPATKTFLRCETPLMVLDWYEKFLLQQEPFRCQNYTDAHCNLIFRCEIISWQNIPVGQWLKFLDNASTEFVAGSTIAHCCTSRSFGFRNRWSTYKSKYQYQRDHLVGQSTSSIKDWQRRLTKHIETHTVTQVSVTQLNKTFEPTNRVTHTVTQITNDHWPALRAHLGVSTHGAWEFQWCRESKSRETKF